MSERTWIVYDSRGLTDTDRAAIYVCCDSEAEARGFVFDPKGCGFDDGVVYSYAHEMRSDGRGGEIEHLVDERFEFVGPLLNGEKQND